LIPLFIALSNGEAGINLSSGVYWPFLFVLGMVPAVLMNVFEEWVFEDIVSKKKKDLM
jgi:hypothetical protein